MSWQHMIGSFRVQTSSSDCTTPTAALIKQKDLPVPLQPVNITHALYSNTHCTLQPL